MSILKHVLKNLLILKNYSPGIIPASLDVRDGGSVKQFVSEQTRIHEYRMEW